MGDMGERDRKFLNIDALVRVPGGCKMIEGPVWLIYAVASAIAISGGIALALAL